MHVGTRGSPGPDRAARQAFDVVVVGGGHAGLEAALAAARLGARTALVTHDSHEIGRMPCNPAIGGLGKGHLVREIDVLGGQMALAIDATGLQFRVLNTKKGPAVRSPRAQADKHLYQRAMEECALAQAGLAVIAGDVVEILAQPLAGDAARGQATGVRLADGRIVKAARVVLGSGTFLRGLMHVGDTRTSGGREGAASAEGLSANLRRLGFELRRLKTGTPPRLWRESIDFSRLQPQPGDAAPHPFSLRTAAFAPVQVDCHQVWTNATTHALIRANLDRSPLYGGAIEGRGPRYCPSIEDKVVRFADKERHLLFLEPEGRDDPEIYVNGLSTSLPADVQEQLVRSLPGLERARLARYGYAVEYDSVPSWQVNASLESKPIAGLYLAGQVLGTSGYEEAAAQGLVAGLNAVRGLDGGVPLPLARETSYLGVLIDDLVTKEITEPYRMFTSRAEHRLHLRCDNAEQRLGALALEVGLLDWRGSALLRARADYVVGLHDVMRSAPVRVAATAGASVSAAQYLLFPGVDLEAALAAATATGGEAGPEVAARLAALRATLAAAAPAPHVRAGAEAQVESDLKYGGYIAKQARLLVHRERLDARPLPADLDYNAMSALSFEAREKLTRIRPATLGQAGRIDGVRAGDLAVLTVYLRKRPRAPGAGPGARGPGKDGDVDDI